MPLPTRFLALACFGLALALSACGDAFSPEETAPEGLFDDSPLLPALSAADAGDWQWIPTDGMQCRDGSDTGFGLRRAAGSRDLLIYLEGGGACFDFLTCLLNPRRFSEADFDARVAEVGESGAFSSTAAANPFLGWNVLYVPYCTGDVHSGDATGVRVPGVGRQDFVGLRNMEAMLNVIDGPARQADQVVLSGSSAGGFGTVGTYGLVSDRLAPAPVDLLNDSGPSVEDDAVFPPSLQQTWRDLWALDASIPAGCPDAICSQPDGDGLEAVLPYYAITNPDRNFGLFTYDRDLVIRSFFGGPSGPAFENSLFDLRPVLPANAGTYFVPGSDHTFLLGDAFYNTTVEGVPLTSWVANLVNGQATDLPAAQSLMVAQGR
ncbi:MAG: pectin acetylesterase-family hydrolase [Bacteroidota bacterium]